MLALFEELGELEVNHLGDGQIEIDVELPCELRLSLGAALRAAANGTRAPATLSRVNRLTRRELVLGAGALALGAADALGMPARDTPGARPGRARAAPARARCASSRGGCEGPSCDPGPAYAGAARVYNLRFDGAPPDAVVEPLDSRDVQAVLRWADRHDVRVTARSGGHSYAGYSTLDRASSSTCGACARSRSTAAGGARASARAPA